ncbi:MAG TPA: biliverdin-producing heme oxygenase [Kofleriaceae bacterium]
MLQQLEYATRGHHVAADAGRINLLGANITREKYIDYLQRTYAFEAPIEGRLQLISGIERAIDLHRRLRVGFLASDLRALGCEPEAIMSSASFVGVEQGLGWLYVIERGRRMNSMLQRHLLRRIPGVLSIAGNYLATSAVIGTRWQQLGIALDRVAHSHAAADQILNAAHRAFRALRGTLPRTTTARAA